MSGTGSTATACRAGDRAFKIGAVALGFAVAAVVASRARRHARLAAGRPAPPVT